MEKIVILLWILFALYIEVLLIVGADFWSGITKAKKNGVVRSSYGFRRTIEKLSKYYNFMIAFTFIDSLQMGSIWYMEEFYSYKIPLFPFITLFGAISISLIEIKSIYEKAEDKVKLLEVGDLAGKIIANKDDITEIVKAVTEYMKTNPEETTVKITTKTKELNNTKKELAE